MNHWNRSSDAQVCIWWYTKWDEHFIPLIFFFFFAEFNPFVSWLYHLQTFTCFFTLVWKKGKLISCMITCERIFFFFFSLLSMYNFLEIWKSISSFIFVFNIFSISRMSTVIISRPGMSLLSAKALDMCSKTSLEVKHVELNNTNTVQKWPNELHNATVLGCWAWTVLATQSSYFFVE